MKRFTVTFKDGRCGRRTDVPAFDVQVQHVAEAGPAVLRVARTYLASRGIDYDMDWGDDERDAHGFVYAGDRQVGEWNAVLAECPRCTSPQPGLHPAVQAGGEVQVCTDPFHTAPAVTL